MEQTLYFTQMFPDCDVPASLKSILEQTVIRKANIDVESRYIFAEIFSPVYIADKDLSELKSTLIFQYELHRLDFDLYHPVDQLCKMSPDELRDMFVRYDSMARGSLQINEVSTFLTTGRCKSLGSLKSFL